MALANGKLRAPSFNIAGGAPLRDDRLPALVMLGPDANARGGIASVLRIWRHGGLRAVARCLSADLRGWQRRCQVAGLCLGVAAIHRPAAWRAGGGGACPFGLERQLPAQRACFSRWPGGPASPISFTFTAAPSTVITPVPRALAGLDRAYRARRGSGFVLSENWAAWLRQTIGRRTCVCCQPGVAGGAACRCAPRAAPLLFLGRQKKPKAFSC